MLKALGLLKSVICRSAVVVVMLLSATGLATRPVTATSADSGTALIIPPIWRTAFSRPAPVQGNSPIARLGEKLFADTRLSGDGTRSCATCHQPDRAFTDGVALAAARRSTTLARNTPTLLNVGWARAFNWDASATSLEVQAVRPITSRLELAGRFNEIVQSLETDPAMHHAFRQAFPQAVQPVSQTTLLAALAAYQRTLSAPLTAFDSWVGGDASALSPSALRGFAIFVGKGGCVACHSGWRMSDDALHDIGLPLGDAPGNAAEPGIRAFKTPTLRAIASTAPYMHDGSIASLAGVIRHYADGVVRRRGLSHNMPTQLELAPVERGDLVAFLEAL